MAAIHLKDYRGVDKVSLHDCRCQSVFLEDGWLSVVFPKGFYVCDKGNVTSGEMRIHLLDDVSIYRFEKRRNGIIRIEESLNQWMDKVNCDDYEFEFLYQYDGYHSVIFTGCLWREEKPYHTDYQLEFLCDEISYFYEEE